MLFKDAPTQSRGLNQQPFSSWTATLWAFYPNVYSMVVALRFFACLVLVEVRGAALQNEKPAEARFTLLVIEIRELCRDYLTG